MLSDTGEPNSINGINSNKAPVAVRAVLFGPAKKLHVTAARQIAGDSRSFLYPKRKKSICLSANNLAEVEPNPSQPAPASAWLFAHRRAELHLKTNYQLQINHLKAALFSYACIKKQPNPQKTQPCLTSCVGKSRAPGREAEVPFSLTSLWGLFTKASSWRAGGFTKRARQSPRHSRMFLLLCSTLPTAGSILAGRKGVSLRQFVLKSHFIITAPHSSYFSYKAAPWLPVQSQSVLPN